MPLDPRAGSGAEGNADVSSPGERARAREDADRIERLLEDVQTLVGPIAWPRVEELLERVMRFHGEAIERVLAIGVDSSSAPDLFQTRLCDDDLAAGLLLLHGLHPAPATKRIEDALDEVRPYLSSHGGGVEMLGLEPDGTARLRLVGGCHGCPSSQATIEGAIERAVVEAAPEVTRVAVEGEAEAPEALIRIGSRKDWRTRWWPLEADIPAGARRALVVEGVPILVLSLGEVLVAYRNACAACGAPLDQAALSETSNRVRLRGPVRRRAGGPRSGRASRAVSALGLGRIGARRASGGRVIGIPALARYAQRGAKDDGPTAGVCELCGALLSEPHAHVVDLDRRVLDCACRACALLFEKPGAAKGRYRTVPDRVRVDRSFTLSESAWSSLRVPVRLAFLFFNSSLERWVAFYPSPAGTTESELALEAFGEVFAASALVAAAQPDVEAILVYGERGAETLDHWLVPIDVCYDLVARVRRSFAGFDGGPKLRADLDMFFAALRARSREIDRSRGRP